MDLSFVYKAYCDEAKAVFLCLTQKKKSQIRLNLRLLAEMVGFSRALKTAHRADFARRDAKRRARAVLIPPATSLHRAKRKPPALFFTLTALAEMVGFSRALKTAHWAVFARRDAKRRSPGLSHFESLKLLDEAGSSRLSLAAEGILVTSKKARHTAICRQKSAAFCEMTLEKAFFTQAVSGCISGVVVLDVR